VNNYGVKSLEVRHEFLIDRNQNKAQELSSETGIAESI
jgi:hypothetical protein